VVRRAGLPGILEVSAWTDDGLVMGLRVRGLPARAPVEGVQFHPESILTGVGKDLLRNFVASGA
jgi:anthranilate/para-aminobenzoate synthase component II